MITKKEKKYLEKIAIISVFMIIVLSQIVFFIIKILKNENPFLYGTCVCLLLIVLFIMFPEEVKERKAEKQTKKRTFRISFKNKEESFRSLINMVSKEELIEEKAELESWLNIIEQMREQNIFLKINTLLQVYQENNQDLPYSLTLELNGKTIYLPQDPDCIMTFRIKYFPGSSMKNHKEKLEFGWNWNNSSFSPITLDDLSADQFERVKTQLEIELEKRIWKIKNKEKIDLQKEVKQLTNRFHHALESSSKRG